MQIEAPDTAFAAGALEGRYVFPASFGQQRLWFLQELDPRSGSAYVIDGVIRMLGVVDRRVIQRAVDEIVARHETLRTCFAVVDGEPVQVIVPALRLAVPVVDLSKCGAGERESELWRVARSEVRRPFDLAQAPLVRVTLVRLAAREHVLVVVLHHSISDGWSGSIFVRELAELYEAFVAGRQPRLAELPVQYADYAVWQREWLQGGELERQLDHWRGRLAGVPPLELPTDRPRPALQSFDGAICRAEVPPQVLAPVERLAREEDATLFMTLLAAFAVLLGRYSRQEDIAVGTPIAGRTRPELEELIGFFVNNLVLRVDLAGDPSFRGLLRRVRELCLDAYANQEIPFERLVEELHPARDLSRTPLFQVMFVLRTEPLPILEFPGLQLSALEIDPGTSKFDLTLILTPRADGLGARLEYCTELFDDATAGRMLECFRILLEEMASDPDQPISRVDLRPAADRSRLRRSGRGGTVELPEGSLPSLVDAQADRTPHTEAVVWRDECLTYRELVAHANALAHELRELGVGPETLVGVALERSPWLPVALLGILKAGGAYVPVDPRYPAERMRFMLEDADASVLVTEAALLERLPRAGERVLCIDREWRERRATDSPAGPDPDHLAYVIYTSGSTGRPKGVMVPHRALANLLLSMSRAPGLEGSDSLVAVTTLSFDIAGLELFLPLIVGARLIVASREEAGDGIALAHLLRDFDATAMQATPATWRLLLDAGWRPSAPFKALCGGETLPPRLASRLLETGAAVWNLYGPTETTIWSTAQRLDDAAEPIPLGRPIDNTQISVLDEAGNPVPIGVFGELCIGGLGVARGYLRRPALTAERFVPDPEGDGTRLYRTGDLVRFRETGVLEFVGRLDQQVKIRGFRVELGEIEATLREHELVREAAASVREDGPGDKRLVAYVVLDDRGRDDGAGDPVAGLRDYLRARLPEFMVPSAFVPLDALPRTPNDKIDRAALPPPGRRPASEYREPRTPVERGVAEVFARALGIDRVGLDDDFFALGGHSLLAAGVIHELRGTFVAELPLQQVFFDPTVAGVAAAIEASSATTEGSAPGLDEEPAAPGLTDAEIGSLLAEPTLALRSEEEKP